MADYGGEAEYLAELNGALVINTGVVLPQIVDGYVQAVKAYSARGNPVVLDPVGVGATAVRRDAVARIIAAGTPDVIKGNEGEINFLLGQSSAQQKGVDSGVSTSTDIDKGTAVAALARRFGV
jgi:thiamine-phosphate diphosphorylase/hydroxyethylthiazole kinase